jgi:hypothetical protein
MAEDLVEKVISFFSGDNNEKLSDLEVVLKQRYKELGENKYSKFFRAKTDEADPALGQFFYSLYKIILPTRIFMKDTAQMTRLRQIVLESFMDSSITDTIKRLNPARIGELAKTTPPAKLTEQIQKDIEKLVSEFGLSRRNGINRCFNLVTLYSQFVNYDYPGVLKKFDPNFTEGPFASDPKFAPVKVSALEKDLSDFLAVSQNINPDNDWNTLLKLLRICAGEELISESKFAQMLIGLRDVINSKIMELLVQYGGKKPVWACKPKIPDEHIAESWLETRTAKAQECIDKINNEEKNKEISALVKDIFSTDELERLENYTVSKSEVYQRKDLSGFAYAEGLNYLSVFLSDNLEKRIKELLDILLIRGQWTNNASSKEVSEALHQLLDMPAPITSLDETLSDDGVNGSRLKAALIRVDRDRTQTRYINTIIDNINITAQELLENAAQHFGTIAKHLKSLTEDILKKHPELIINWRELNSVSREPLSQMMTEEFNRVNNFVQLMRLCAQ